MSKTFPKLIFSVIVLFLCQAFLVHSVSFAQENKDMIGWEKGSDYNKLYNPGEMDSFKGVVVDIREVVPMPGMAPGIELIVRDQDNDEVPVQLGPKSFVNLGKIGLKKGDKVKVKGSWSEIGKEDIFVASKVKKGEYEELKVRRTKDGTPYWTMTPEELAGEKGQE